MFNKRSRAATALLNFPNIGLPEIYDSNRTFARSYVTVRGSPFPKYTVFYIYGTQLNIHYSCS